MLTKPRNYNNTQIAKEVGSCVSIELARGLSYTGKMALTRVNAQVENLLADFLTYRDDANKIEMSRDKVAAYFGEDWEGFSRNKKDLAEAVMIRQVMLFNEAGREFERILRKQLAMIRNLSESSQEKIDELGDLIYDEIIK
jgi:chaperonin cofactor prefoldin